MKFVSVQVIDFFSFDGEARDKPKPASEIRRFQRPGDVPGDEPKAHRAMGTFNLGGLLEPDKMQPFDKLNRRMVCAPVKMCAECTLTVGHE